MLTSNLIGQTAAISQTWFYVPTSFRVKNLFDIKRFHSISIIMKIKKEKNSSKESAFFLVRKPILRRDLKRRIYEVEAIRP